MASCPTKSEVDEALKSPNVEELRKELAAALGKIPCHKQGGSFLPMSGGALDAATITQITSLVGAIVVSISATTNIVSAQETQCGTWDLILGALTNANYCDNQANTLKNSVEWARTTYQILGASTFAVVVKALGEAATASTGAGAMKRRRTSGRTRGRRTRGRRTSNKKKH